MKKSDLIRAYDSIQPGEQVYDKVWDRISEAAHETTPVKKNIQRRAFLLAACICLIAALSGIGYAGYQKWSLPKPESYALTENGNVNILQTSDYDTVEENPEALSDAYFIAKAVEILETVGLTDVDTGKMTVVRQENLYWNRTEAEVFFTEDEVNTSVNFDAQTGALLSLSGIDWVGEGAHACQTQQEAERLATQYYQLLPVPQGYVLTGHTEYDEQYWSFEFCREVMEGLYSWYEMVRVGVNPLSGRLTGCNVFSVPLLDDHEPGDVPLTQEQAERIAQDCEGVNLSGCVLRSAEVRVVMPNWFFVDFEPNLQASNVTRLGWSLTYERPDSECADETLIYVDYYTGEILGGDMT